MSAEKETVERLAKAWLAEAKRLRSISSCACGCERSIQTKTRFISGHDAKLLKDYRQRIRSILDSETPF